MQSLDGGDTGLVLGRQGSGGGGTWASWLAGMVAFGRVEDVQGMFASGEKMTAAGRTLGRSET